MKYMNKNANCLLLSSQKMMHKQKMGEMKNWKIKEYGTYINGSNLGMVHLLIVIHLLTH